ncbi:hypothetical protein ACWGI9_12845 [Streptomyces sp. NPDC054833]
MPIVAPRGQTESKRIRPARDSTRPRRTKDAEDIARLQAALRER